MHCYIYILQQPYTYIFACLHEYLILLHAYTSHASLYISTLSMSAALAELVDSSCAYRVKGYINECVYRPGEYQAF